MRHLSESNKKILTQSIESEKNKIPTYVMKMMQNSKCPKIHLGEKFKNMQDPLSYIQSKKIEQLKKDTFIASKSLHQEMDEVFEVSKHSYKQVMTPQGNRYDFDELLVRRFNNDQTLYDRQFHQKIKSRSQKMKKQKQYDPQDFMQRLKKLNPLKDLSNLLAKDNQFYRRTQFDDFDDDNKVKVQRPLNYNIIKQMGNTGLTDQFDDVEFYEILKKQQINNRAPITSQFDLENNRRINRPSINPTFKLIQSSQQFGSLSQQLFYDFPGNLNFWGAIPGKQLHDERKKKISQEDTIRTFMDIDMNQIDTSYLIKFATKKIMPYSINEHQKLAKIHKKLQYQIQGQTQALVKQYHKLLQQYRFLRNLKRTKRQGAPIKLINSQAQTIYTMPDQQFDGYFKNDTLEILKLLNKLNVLREKVLVSQQFRQNKNQQHNNKIVMVQNICYDIKQVLFKLLLMMLKGQRFLSPQGYVMFSYGDLMMSDNRQQVQNRVLKFILTNIDKFQVQEVDNVLKSDVIRIYAQEKDKNNRILEIIRAK